MSIMDLLGVFKNLDGDTVTLLTRFAMRAVRTGEPNEFIKRHLRKIIDDMDDEDRRNVSKPTVTVTSRVVR